MNFDDPLASASGIRLLQVEICAPISTKMESRRSRVDIQHLKSSTCTATLVMEAKLRVVHIKVSNLKEVISKAGVQVDSHLFAVTTTEQILGYRFCR